MSPAVELLIAGLVVFVAQLVYGVTGFGAALIAVPLLSLLWGGPEAVLVSTGCMVLAGLVLLLPAARTRVEPQVVGVMMLPGILGTWLGSALLVSLPVQTLRTILGVLVVIAALPLLLRPVRPGRGAWEALPPVGRAGPLAVLALAGLGGGLMGGLTGAGGPPLVLGLKHYFAPATFRANLIAGLLAGGLVMLVVLGLRGIWSQDSLLHVALLVPAVFLGSRTGAWLSAKVPTVAFTRMVALLLIATGGALVALR